MSGIRELIFDLMEFFVSILGHLNLILGLWSSDFVLLGVDFFALVNEHMRDPQGTTFASC